MHSSSSYGLIIVYILCQEFPGHLFSNCQNGKCFSCPSTCVTCESESYCNECKPGYYGQACTETCKSYCANNICSKHLGLCSSCEKDYFLDKNLFCIHCPSNCLVCTAEDFCSKCEAGYRGTTCQQSCLNCKPGKSCDKITGECGECNDGLSGIHCDIKCNSQCKSCQRLKENECTSCLHARYGESCYSVCSNNCLEATCNETNGSCTFGCSTGYWGNMCNYTCHRLCRNSMCNRFDGSCQHIQEGRAYGSATIFTIVPIIIVMVLAVTGIAVCYGRKRTLCCAMGQTEARTIPPNDTSECQVNLDDEEDNLISESVELISKGSVAAPLQGDGKVLGAYYVDGIMKKRAYIVCKDPKTIGETYEFWKMVYNEDCNIILMLTDGEVSTQGSNYFPDEGKEQKYDNICVKTDAIHRSNFYALRTFCIIQNMKEKKVYQWATNFSLNVKKLIHIWKRWKRRANNISGPVLIHSSDSVSRCGLYMALDMFWSETSLTMDSCRDHLREQNSELLTNNEEIEVLKTVQKQSPDRMDINEIIPKTNKKECSQ